MVNILTQKVIVVLMHHTTVTMGIIFNVPNANECVLVSSANKQKQTILINIILRIQELAGMEFLTASAFARRNELLCIKSNRIFCTGHERKSRVGMFNI